jgi:hypothetical protein
MHDNPRQSDNQVLPQRDKAEVGGRETALADEVRWAGYRMERNNWRKHVNERERRGVEQAKKIR